MEVIFALLVIAGTVAAIAVGRRGGSAGRALKTGVPSKSAERRTDSGIAPVVPKVPIMQSYEVSVFKTESGGFCFPKYGVRHIWVRITDNTPFKEMWAELEKSEKAEYTVSDFEEQFSGGAIELEVAPFWEALRGAKKADLAEFGRLAGHAEALEEIWHSQFESTVDGGETEHEDERFDLTPGLGAALVELGAASRIDLGIQANLGEWLQLKTGAALKEIAKSGGLSTSGTKGELISRICASPNTAELSRGAFYCTVNSTFGAVIDKLGKKYVERIRDQIQGWHPLYVQAVWEEAPRENDGSAPASVVNEIRIISNAA